MLRKRGSTWHLDMVTPEGKRVRRSTGTSERREALRIAQAFQRETAEAPDGRTTVTLGDATRRYVAHLKAQRKASAPGVDALRSKALGLNPQMAGRFALSADLPLHNLSPVMLADLVAARQAEGNGPQTIAHELKMLRASSLHAKELGLRAAEVTKWRLPSAPAKTRYLSLGEFRALVEALDPAKAPTHLHAYMQDAQDLTIALGMTGGRWGEVAGLTWAQLDPPAFTTLRLWGNKTGRERLAPVTAALRGVLQRRWLVPGREGPLVFPRASGGLRVGSCKPILRAMDRLGLNAPESVARYGRATVHSLRHSFASYLLQDGVGLAEVQDMLGHQSMQMTRRYAHLENAKVASRMADRLDAMTTKGEATCPMTR